MTGDYSAQRKKATAAIAAKGGAATLRRAGAQTGDEWNPNSGVPTDYTVSVVDLGIRERQREGSVTETVRTVMMGSEDGVTPIRGDIMTVNSRGHLVKEVRPLQPAPGGVVVFYEVDLET